MDKFVIGFAIISFLYIFSISQQSWGLSYDKIESDLIFPNHTFQYTFTNIGIFNYHCQLHPWLTGTVSVNDYDSPINVVIKIPKGSVESNNKVSFEPNHVTIGTGSTIIWNNTDAFSHTVANIDTFPKVTLELLLIGSPIAPLKQLKSGIAPKDVVCKQGLELVMKKSNGQPICVKGTSVKTLTLRNYIPEYVGALGGEIPTETQCNEKKNLDLVKIPQIGEPSRLVFFVKQNTTAHICIKYSSNLDNEGTLDLNAESYDGYLGTFNDTQSNVPVTINPNLIPLQKGQSTIADYAISIPQGTDGVFWLTVSQMCDSIPITTSNHRIIPDDIPVIVGGHSCPAIMLDAKMIGYSGAEVQYHNAKALKGR